MPLSICDGRGWVYDRIRDTTSDLIVDAGCGEGTYSVLARHLRQDAEWWGIEIHEPYVERFLLHHKYDRVIVTDIRGWTFPQMHNDYTLLLGDVLEHMSREDAIDVLAFHMQHAAEIMVSVPIVYAPQGACEGNEHEAHLYHWTWDEMTDLLPGCEGFRGVTVGRWWWRRDD